MPLPVGVETRTVRLQVPLDALGNPPKVYAGDVRPDRTIIWAATGDRLWPVGAKLPAVVDGFIEFDVPIVDQDGWIDVDGVPITGWAYKLVARGTWDVSSRSETRTFQVEDATPAVVDIELLPSGATLPVELGDPYVSSFVGHSGAITGAQLDEELGDLLDARAVVASGPIAYAENRTAVTTEADAAAHIYIPGCMVVVPPTERDVWLRYGALFNVSAPGQGILYLATWDITTGVAVAVEALPTRCYTNEVVRPVKAAPRGICRVGPSDELRRYMMTVKTAQEDSALLGYVSNSVTFNGSSWLAAVA